MTPNQEISTNRFYTEFWFICLIVSVGLVSGYNVGFYAFRFADLIFILSIVYFLINKKNRTDKKLIFYYSLLLLYIVVRSTFDAQQYLNLLNTKTLFGMTMTYLTPIIFLVTRNSIFNSKHAKYLLYTACIVSIFSQLGLLLVGEKEASGTVDLGKLFNLGTTMTKVDLLGYQERTITIWRALSIGFAFALIFVRTKPIFRIAGIIGLFLQTAGGGGGRGGLLFVIVTPILLFIFLPNSSKYSLTTKMLIGIAGAIIFSSLYLWAPLGEKFTIKDSGKLVRHEDRAEEIFILFTEGWSGVSAKGGMNARTQGWEEYVDRIFSDQNIFLFGVGLYKGAAFMYTGNMAAHNMILDVWSLIGILGLLLFLIFNYFVIVDMIYLLKVTPKNSYEQVFIYSFAIAVFYFYQPLLFQAVTSDRSYMIVFFLLTGTLRPFANSLNDNQAHEVRLNA